MFESDSPTFCWDGTANGQKLDADVFVYVIKASYNYEPEIIKSGNITLIR
jgi:hypothetical protein